MGNVEIAENLRVYLDLPELVDGWITPQAIALKDGTVRYTEYFRAPGKGLILRSALESDHPESPQGLLRRFDAGERFIPDTENCHSSQASRDRDKSPSRRT